MNWEYYNGRYSIPAFEASWAAGRCLNSRGLKPFMALRGTPPEWMLDTKPLTPEPAKTRVKDLNKLYHLNAAMYNEFAKEVVSLHFVQPCARVASSSDSDSLLISSFYDGARDTVILVGVKQGGPNQVELRLSGLDRSPSAWDLYQTMRVLNCAKSDTIVPRNGVARVEVPDETVFTLVGKLSSSAKE